MPVREIQPTRSELLEVTKKIKLTKNGHKILKLRRDGLILEFFKILDQSKNLRREIAARYKEAQEKIAIANAVDGAIEVRSAAYAPASHPEIKLRSRNLMGVVVPDIKSSRIVAPLDERGYGIIGTSPRIDEATDAYEKLVETVGLRLDRGVLEEVGRSFHDPVRERERRQMPVTGRLHVTLDRLEGKLRAHA